MAKTVYIHFWMSDLKSEFDKNIFKPIQNGCLGSKPSGGLWASPVNSKWGWKDWCISEGFRLAQLDSSFCFVLTDAAKVLHLRSVADANKLPRYCPYPEMEDTIPIRYIDFEKLMEKYDAIEFHLSEDRKRDAYWNSLYFKMCSWDCDSILIMNPDIVVPISVEKEEER